MNVEHLRALTVGELLDALVGARGESESRSRLVPIKAAPVAYRAILHGEKAGEITVYRKGKAAFVDMRELDAWIIATGAPKRQAEPLRRSDEVGALIAMQRRRAG